MSPRGRKWKHGLWRWHLEWEVVINLPLRAVKDRVSLFACLLYCTAEKIKQACFLIVLVVADKLYLKLRLFRGDGVWHREAVWFCHVCLLQYRNVGNPGLDTWRCSSVIVVLFYLVKRYLSLRVQKSVTAALRSCLLWSTLGSQNKGVKCCFQ